MWMVLLNLHFSPSVSFSKDLSYVHCPALLQQFQYHSCAFSIIFNNLFMRHLNVPQGIIFPNLTDIFQIKILTDYWFHHCLPHLLLNIQKMKNKFFNLDFSHLIRYIQHNRTRHASGFTKRNPAELLSLICFILLSYTHRNSCLIP